MPLCANKVRFHSFTDVCDNALCIIFAYDMIHAVTHMNSHITHNSLPTHIFTVLTGKSSVPTVVCCQR